jgi:predicted SAM-dependent methyltransferase
MTARAEAMLGVVPRSAKLIEIGPSHNPALPKADGWNVHTIDHATQAELIEKYANDPSVDTARIEAVDYVWKSGSLAEAVPQSEHGSFDGFVASHVIEHTTDLVAFLEAAQILLKPLGSVGLAIPDKRYCFDYFQPLTTVGAVLDAHFARRSRHRAGAVFDHVAYAVAEGGNGAWSQQPVTHLSFFSDLDNARRTFEIASQSDGPYVDTHNWRFTPASFQLVMLELGWMGLTDWKIDRLKHTVGCEFFVQLRRGGTAWARKLSQQDLQSLRLRLLKRTLVEQRAQIDWLLAGEPELGLAPGPRI